MLEDRYTEIERENRILLEKMSQILNKNGREALPQKRPLPRSLNERARKEELQRINRENKRFLERLQDREATYNVSKWEAERIRNEQILESMCEYPHIFKRESPIPSFSTLCKSELHHNIGSVRGKL